jgi:hypothetical protein
MRFDSLSIHFLRLFYKPIHEVRCPLNILATIKLRIRLGQSTAKVTKLFVLLQQLKSFADHRRGIGIAALIDTPLDQLGCMGIKINTHGTHSLAIA